MYYTPIFFTKTLSLSNEPKKTNSLIKATSRRELLTYTFRLGNHSDKSPAESTLGESFILTLLPQAVMFLNILK